MKPWSWQSQEPEDFGDTGKPVWPNGESPNKARQRYSGGSAGSGSSYDTALFAATTALGIPILLRK